MPIPTDLSAEASAKADLDFAQALSVAEAAAVLFAQKIVETTGEPAPGAALLHDPQLALSALRQIARTATNPRIAGAARHTLSAFYGADVDRHPELVDPQFRMQGTPRFGVPLESVDARIRRARSR